MKMATAQVIETSATVNNNSPIQDYVRPDDQTQPTFEMTPGFKPFTEERISLFFLCGDTGYHHQINSQNIKRWFRRDFCTEAKLRCDDDVKSEASHIGY